MVMLDLLMFPNSLQKASELLLMTDINRGGGDVLLSRLNEHVRSKKHHYLLNKLIQECGILLITTVLQYISTLQ